MRTAALGTPRFVALISTLSLLGSCERPAAESVEAAPNCEADKAGLIQLVQRLPERAMPKEIRVSLPTSSLGGGLGPGSILELSEGWVALDGVVIEGKTHPETIEKLKERLKPPDPAATTLYVAASADTDVSTLQSYLRALPKGWVPKLLFGAPSLSSDPSLSGHDLAARMFAERDPVKRATIAKEAYGATATCAGVAEAARSVETTTGEERWPTLRSGMLSALPKCACGELDAENLGSVLVAEQRSSGVAIGSLPVDFLADERCAAAMPLRSMQQVLGDAEKFEEEFSGQWQGDALSFEEILTSDRLLVYLCGALPGETLASMQRARRTLWFKTEQGCKAMRFAPLSPGAPMGSWQRLDDGKESAFALHYRQYSEEIRLYGPTPNGESRPTDEGPWACTQDFHMTSVDEYSIGLASGGRWFFDEESCQKAGVADRMPSGCVAQAVSGLPLPPTPSPPPAPSAAP